MTTSEAQIPTQASPPAVTPTISPEPDTRLDQLAAEYAALKPLADEYAARLESIKDGIKAELAAAAPGATKVLLACIYLEKPLQLVARTSWRVDMKKLKAEQPETYVRYAVQSTSWSLGSTR
jgi:hypothetical protein